MRPRTASSQPSTRATPWTGLDSQLFLLPSVKQIVPAVEIFTKDADIEARYKLQAYFVCTARRRWISWGALVPWRWQDQNSCGLFVARRCRILHPTSSTTECSVKISTSCLNPVLFRKSRTATRSCRTRKRALHVYSPGVAAARHVGALQ